MVCGVYKQDTLSLVGLSPIVTLKLCQALDEVFKSQEYFAFYHSNVKIMFITFNAILYVLLSKKLHMSPVPFAMGKIPIR